MNTQYIYISNIPSNCKPVLLLHELKNKWARMLYLENSFSGLRDAFIYNPTDSFEQFCEGVQNLRNKVIDGMKSLSVYFIWFPPTNVFITTMIPAGASMLSYLIVENLHKDVIPSEVIYDLPLQMSDIKNWDIPERQDKCIIVKLPPTCNTAMRSFLLGTLRSRPIRGLPPRVSELIISEQHILSSEMVPRSIKINEPKKESYLSNFFYIHDIPSNLTVKMLIEAAKAENIRGARVFFLETSNNMKYGFMYVPRSLPNTRFMAFYEKLKATEYLLETGTCNMKVERAWFQPMSADPPVANVDHGEEMLLTEYLYLSDIPPGVQAIHLSSGCPWPIKLYVFQVNEISTQIGFVVLRGIGETEAGIVTNYLRNLDMSGARIQVDEVYLQCRGLPADLNERPFQLRPRQNTQSAYSRVTAAPKRLMLNQHSNGVCGFVDEVILTSAPENGDLMKTDFVCVANLPRNVARAGLIFDIGRPSDGCIIIANGDSCTAFIYFPECEVTAWKTILKKLSEKVFDGRRAMVYEVYLKTELSSSSEYQDFIDSNFVFVFNIARAVEGPEVMELWPGIIEGCELLETTSGSKSAFLLLASSCQEEDKLAFLFNIRKKFLRGKPVYADMIKLAPVRLADTNGAKRSKYE